MTENPELPELTPEEIAAREEANEMIRYRDEGLSLKAIGEKFGVSAMTVRRRLHGRGRETGQSAEVRSRVARTASRTRWGNQDGTKGEDILAIHWEHPEWPCRLIAAEAGASYSWTWNVLTAAGAEIAPDKHRRKSEENNKEE